MMKKRNGNFEYFKPQNGGSLAVSESESENSNDSDSKKMFSLPKRKVVRSIKTHQRSTRKCCRVCLAASLPLILAILIVGICASMVYMLLGINGMKREVELLKVRLKQVESADHSNLQESSKLQASMKEQIEKMKLDEKKVANIDKKLHHLSAKLNTLNRTVSKLKKFIRSKSSFSSIAKDVEQLKKGMADTDVEIRKLSDDSSSTDKSLALALKLVKKVNERILNITSDLTKLTARQSSKSDRKSSGSDNKQESEILKKMFSAYEHKLLNKTKTIAVVLRDHEYKLEQMNDRITITENKTVLHHKQIDVLKKICVLLTSEVKSYRNKTGGKFQQAFALIMKDLSKNSLNLTSDLLGLKSLFPADIQSLIADYVKTIKQSNVGSTLSPTVVTGVTDKAVNESSTVNTTSVPTSSTFVNASTKSRSSVDSQPTVQSEVASTVATNEYSSNRSFTPRSAEVSTEMHTVTSQVPETSPTVSESMISTSTFENSSMPSINFTGKPKTAGTGEKDSSEFSPSDIPTKEQPTSAVSDSSEDSQDDEPSEGTALPDSRTGKLLTEDTSVPDKEDETDPAGDLYENSEKGSGLLKNRSFDRLESVRGRNRGGSKKRSRSRKWKKFERHDKRELIGGRKHSKKFEDDRSHDENDSDYQDPDEEIRDSQESDLYDPDRGASVHFPSTSQLLPENNAGHGVGDGNDLDDLDRTEAVD